MLVVFIGALAIGPLLDAAPAAGRIIVIVCASVSLAVLILAPAINKSATAAAAENIMKIE